MQTGAGTQCSVSPLWQNPAVVWADWFSVLHDCKSVTVLLSGGMCLNMANYIQYSRANYDTAGNICAFYWQLDVDVICLCFSFTAYCINNNGLLCSVKPWMKRHKGHDCLKLILLFITNIRSFSQKYIILQYEKGAFSVNDVFASKMQGLCQSWGCVLMCLPGVCELPGARPALRARRAPVPSPHSICTSHKHTRSHSSLPFDSHICLNPNSEGLGREDWGGTFSACDWRVERVKESAFKCYGGVFLTQPVLSRQLLTFKLSLCRRERGKRRVCVHVWWAGQEGGRGEGGGGGGVSFLSLGRVWKNTLLQHKSLSEWPFGDSPCQNWGNNRNHKRLQPPSGTAPPPPSAVTGHFKTLTVLKSNHQMTVVSRSSQPAKQNTTQTWNVRSKRAATSTSPITSKNCSSQHSHFIEAHWFVASEPLSVWTCLYETCLWNYMGRVLIISVMFCMVVVAVREGNWVATDHMWHFICSTAQTKQHSNSSSVRITLQWGCQSQPQLDQARWAGGEQWLSNIKKCIIVWGTKENVALFSVKRWGK